MKRNTNETSSDIEEEEVSRSNIKERFKKIWSLNIIQRLLCFLSSIWIYVPIIAGIITAMLYMIPLAYTSWVLFLSLGNAGWANLIYAYNLNRENLPLGIVLAILESMVFLVGLTLFIWGFIQIVRARKNEINITQTGPYKHIRHPQHLGIILISLHFALRIRPDFASHIFIYFRVGDILSWVLFCFILIIWSDIEERKLQKRYPEEFADYKNRTGFFFPKIGNRQTLKIQEKKRYYYLIRYLIFFIIYCIVVLIMFLAFFFQIGRAHV